MPRPRNGAQQMDLMNVELFGGFGDLHPADLLRSDANDLRLRGIEGPLEPGDHGRLVPPAEREQVLSDAVEIKSERERVIARLRRAQSQFWQPLRFLRNVFSGARHSFPPYLTL